MVDEDEKLKRTLYVSGQNREMWFLTEDGLYEVLMRDIRKIIEHLAESKNALGTYFIDSTYKDINNL